MQSTKTALAVGAAVATAAAAYAGASWYSGRQAEQAYRQAITDLSAFIGPQAIAAQEYRRGFFSSEGRLTLQWTPATQDGEDQATVPPEPVRLVVTSQVRHGPLAGARLAAAAVETRFALEGLDEQTRQVLSRMQGPQLTAVRHFGGASDLQLRLPAGEIVVDGTALRWQELTGDGSLDSSGKRVSARMAWPEWSFDSLAATAAADTVAGDEGDGEDFGEGEDGPERFAITLRNMTSTFEGEMIDGLWGLGPGKARLQVGSLQTRSAGAAQAPVRTVLDLRELEAESEIVTDQATLGYSTRAQMVGSIGPIRFDSLKLHEQYQRVDIEALRGLLRAFTQGQQGADEAGGSYTLVDAAPRLIAALPSYRMQIEATTQGQTGRLEYGAQVNSAPPAEQLAGGAWLPALLQGGALDARMQLPKAWIGPLVSATGRPAPSDEELQQLLAAAESSGYVRLQGEQLSGSLALRGGQWTLNGKPFAGPQLH